MAKTWEGYTDTTNGYVGHYHDSWGFGSYAGWGRAHSNKNSGYGSTLIPPPKTNEAKRPGFFFTD